MILSIVAYRPVARQRPRNKQRVQPLPCNRRMFLSNGSVNTFPQKQNDTTTQLQWKRMCFLRSPFREEDNSVGPVKLSVVSWKSAFEEKTRRLPWNGRQPGTDLLDGWQLSWALQGRLRSNGVIVELAVGKRSFAGYSQDSNDVSAGSWRISTVISRCYGTAIDTAWKRLSGYCGDL
jgi:hypothetical protein